MFKRSLLTGVAYHGNRMPSHVKNDMREIAKADMDIVVHMLSHTDWDRHKNVMKENFAITEDAGMEVWVDPWGLGGPPGDKSHFLAYYPDSHMYLSNGKMIPTYACLNSQDFRKFIKNWIDTVAELGAKTILWDEPHIPKERVSADSEDRFYGCCCERCKKLFEERYNKKMPLFADDDAEQFRTDSIVDYYREVTEYSASLGIKNAIVVMLRPHTGMDLDTIDRLCSLPTLDSIGSDPYWLNYKDANPYEFVYNGTKKTLDACNRFKKDHNMWIQTYKTPRGREEEIILATQAAYDAGARTILAWGFMGSESNDYAAKNPARTWDMTVEAMKRIRAEERDKIIEQNRKLYVK